MNKLSKIIASGVLAQDNIADLLADAIESNQGLATYLCGDNPCPSEDEIKKKALEECEKRNYKFSSIRSVYLDRDFCWRVCINYECYRFAKSPEKTSRYETKENETEEYSFPVTFPDTFEFNVR